MLLQSYNLQEIPQVMKAKIISVGNSKGIIIPATFLKQLSFQEEVELEVEEGALVVRPVNQSRLGWEEQIEKVMKKGPVKKSAPDFFDDEQLEEWTW
jgi:antitoxin MazE